MLKQKSKADAIPDLAYPRPRGFERRFLFGFMPQGEVPDNARYQRRYQDCGFGFHQLAGSLKRQSTDKDRDCKADARQNPHGAHLQAN